MGWDGMGWNGMEWDDGGGFPAGSSGAQGTRETGGA